MYKPPIELYTTDLQTKTNEYADRVIMETVKGIGVDVNKEELIRALQYDRHQYEKGYADGMKDFVKKFEKKIKDVQFTLGQTWEIQCALKEVLKEMESE